MSGNLLALNGYFCKVAVGAFEKNSIYDPIAKFRNSKEKFTSASVPLEEILTHYGLWRTEFLLRAEYLAQP